MEQSGGMGIYIIVIIVAVIISLFFIARKKGYMKGIYDYLSEKTGKTFTDVKGVLEFLSEKTGKTFTDVKEVLEYFSEKTGKNFTDLKEVLRYYFEYYWKMPKMIPKPYIILIGGEGVGKTTLLSVMYKKFKETSSYSPFEPEKNDDRKLMENYARISAISKQKNFILTPLVGGTSGIEKYNIRIENRLFTVCDTAGGLIKTGHKHEDFKDTLSEAEVIINVLDGAAMLEGSDFLAQRINSPMQIMALLNQYKGNNSRCLLLFVITKCEKWINENNIDLLRDAFEKQHKAVLNWIDQNSNCTAMFIPVKTLGCVEFSYKEGEGGEEKCVFVKKPDLYFSQEHVDKPMLYAFQYCTGKTFHPVETYFKRYGNLS